MTLPTSSWIQHSIIYQLFVGRWAQASLIKHPFQVFNQLSNLDLSPLKQIGIDTLYLLGVFDNRGPIIVNVERDTDITHHPQRLPSPFALTNHSNPNPLLGTTKDLKQLINHLHQHDFRVILDYVPNHTSIAHPWVKSHPEFYHFHEGQPVAEFNSDVYKLNYQNQELRHQMTQVLNTIISWGVDGVRADMAHLVPIDFWQQSISSIKSSQPDFAFIAEVYPESPFNLSILTKHLDAGFDSVYHGLLQQNLEQITAHGAPLTYLTNHLNFIFDSFPKNHLTNFISNHDDPLLSASQNYLEPLLSLILFLPGTPFIYNGTLSGHFARLPHHFFGQLESNRTETSSIPAHIKHLFQIKQKHPFVITATNITNNLVVCQMESPPHTASLYLNLTPNPQPIPDQNTHSAGLVHGTTPPDSLPPGKSELFIHL